MKLRILSGIALILLLSLGFQVQAVTLKIATLAPSGTTWMKEMKKGAREIKKQTDGRVKLKFYPGGVMGNDQSVHRKIRINQLQGGAFSSSGLAKIDPAIQIYSLPMVFDSFDEVDHVRQKMDDQVKQHMADNGFVVLGITEGGFARIMSSKPIEGIQSFQNNKVWIPEGDELIQITFDAIGINPIPLTIADVFTGLQTGLIDTITSTSAGAIAFQWHTKINYMVDLPVIYVIGVMAVSQKAFKKIKSNDQKIVINVMNDVFARLEKINRNDNINATKALQTQGIELVKLSDQDIAQLKTLTRNSIQTMVESGKMEADVIDDLYRHLNTVKDQ